MMIAADGGEEQVWETTADSREGDDDSGRRG